MKSLESHIRQVLLERAKAPAAPSHVLHPSEQPHGARISPRVGSKNIGAMQSAANASASQNMAGAEKIKMEDAGVPNEGNDRPTSVSYGPQSEDGKKKTVKEGDEDSGEYFRKNPPPKSAVTDFMTNNLPVVSQVKTAVDAADKVKRGDVGGAALDVLGAVPKVGAVVGAARALTKEEADADKKKKDDDSFTYGDLENKTSAGALKDFIPIVGAQRAAERTKQAWNRGDYGTAALHGLDTGVSAAADAALAVPLAGEIASGVLKGGQALVKGGIKLGSNLLTKGAEKAAVETGVKTAEKGATTTGVKAAETGITKDLVGRAAGALFSGGSGSSSINSITPGQAVSTSAPKTGASAQYTPSRKSKTVKEEAEGTKDRKTVENVGRPDTAKNPFDKKSKIGKQAEIQRKIIDENKKLAGVVKGVVKQTKEEASEMGGAKKKEYPQVTFNPSLEKPHTNETV